MPGVTNVGRGVTRVSPRPPDQRPTAAKLQNTSGNPGVVHQRRVPWTDRSGTAARAVPRRLRPSWVGRRCPRRLGRDAATRRAGISQRCRARRSMNRARKSGGDNNDEHHRDQRDRRQQTVVTGLTVLRDHLPARRSAQARPEPGARAARSGRSVVGGAQRPGPRFEHARRTEDARGLADREGDRGPLRRVLDGLGSHIVANDPQLAWYRRSRTSKPARSRLRTTFAMPVTRGLCTARPTW